VWRRKWINVLAAAGEPKPNVWRLAGQVRKALRHRERFIRQFQLACANNDKLQSKAKTGAMLPRLERVKMTADLGVECTVDMARIGRTVEDLQLMAPVIANVCRARRFIVTEQSPGMAHVVVQFEDALNSVLQFRDLALPAPVKPGDPPRFVGGITEHGLPLEVSTDKPIAVGGEQGSGKSVFGWGAIGSLVHQGLWVVLYVIDPKGGMELGRFSRHVGDWVGRLKVEAFYAGEDVKEGRKVITRAFNAMDMRAKRLGEDGTRKLAAGATQDDPLIILFVDEALDYAEDWKKADSHLMRFTRKARAAGGLTIAIFQFGHASELGVGQKVFGARFCFRAAKETADTILGTGAYERGALTNKIPKSQPGIGYYVDDEGQMLRFRGVNVPDAVADRIAVGSVPDDMGVNVVSTVEKEVACYRLFRSDATSIYVGQSVDPWGNMDYANGMPYGPGGRFEQHADDKPWFDEVDWTLTRVTWHPASKINAVEKAEIHRLGPLYNDQHNRKNPTRVDWRGGDKTVVPFRRPAKQIPDGAPEVLEGEVVSEHVTYEAAEPMHWAE
jgi:hypothetical protein